MTRDETIALWQRCEAARASALAADGDGDLAHAEATKIWNAWANPLLERRAALTAAGQWADELKPSESWQLRRIVGLNAATDEWLREASVDFAGHVFHDAADFSEFVLPSEANFGPAQLDRGSDRPVTFERYASFSGAQFHGGSQFGHAVFKQKTSFETAAFRGPARFSNATFHAGARFNHCCFREEARFGGAEFADGAWFTSAEFVGEARFYSANILYGRFEDAIFRDQAWFDAATFTLFASFQRVRFLNKPALFYGIHSQTAITFDGAHFDQLPDFSQAILAAAPRLDNITFGTSITGGFWRSLIGPMPEARNVVAKFRALRRFAIQGQDHENEAKAFQGEVRAKRWTEHMPYGATFWVGIFYDAFSNFGRSTLRPFLAWVVSVAMFTAAYLQTVPKSPFVVRTCADRAPVWLKAFYLSAKNALLVIGGDKSEEVRAVYACLYGNNPGSADPMIPVTSALLQMAQNLWSAICIFLFLLGVRNQFRIK